MVEKGLQYSKDFEKHFENAMNIYEKLIKVWKSKDNKNNSHLVCEIYFQASRLYKHYGGKSKEIQNLNHCVDWDAEEAQGKIACQFAEKAQDILLEYATSQLKLRKKEGYRNV